MDPEIDKLKQLIDFNKRVYPKRKGVSESIKFKLSAPCNSTPKNEYGFIIVALNNDGRIVGQFQRIPCKYYLEGTRAEAFWGMDYIVEEESRGSAAGVFLAKDALKDPHFGMGLSPISYKIHLILGEQSIGEYYKFIRFKSLLSLVKLGLALITKKHSRIPAMESRTFPEQIRVNKHTTYTRIDDFGDLIWFPEAKKRIEFDRDKSFIEWRFGTYQETFLCYALAAEKSYGAYFICRYVVWKGELFLLLVDYRYNDGNLKSLIKATCKLLAKSKANGIITLSSYYEVDSALRRRGFCRFGENGKIVTNIKHGLSIEEIERRRAVLVTFADSDADFFYGNKEWYDYE